jgi:hypothetical protein
MVRFKYESLLKPHHSFVYALYIHPKTANILAVFHTAKFARVAEILQIMLIEIWPIKI